MSVEDMPEGDGINQDEDVLAEELREAFGSGDFSLDVRDSGFFKRMPGSSAGNDGMVTDAPDLSGARLGDFELIDELGHGGMGVVYRARQLSLRREVALKVLSGPALRKRLAARRFRTEAQAAARLHHTNIVPVYARGEDSGRLYYAMELIDGGSLGAAIESRTRLLSPSNTHLSQAPTTTTRTDDLDPELDEDPHTDHWPIQDLHSLQRGRDDFRHVARMVAGAAEGLEHAHRCGVIHRDIKPQNLLVGKDNRLQITDFGLARLADAPRMTLSGEVMGTPSYLSPEQIQPDSDNIDHRTDIYSLGVTLYELLTLRRPFVGKTRDQILTGIRLKTPRTPRDVDIHVPRDLQTICLKAMEKNPADRYQTAGELAEDLRRFADGRPILSRSPSLIVKTAKWIRRHKALTTAIVSVATVILLTAGLAASFAAARKNKATQLLDEAYEQIVFVNYRSHGDKEQQIAQAERLGADPRRIGKLRAIAALERARLNDALEILLPLAESKSDDAEAAYMLALAYDMNGNQQEADAWVAEGDRVTDKDAAAWFFRGMALHFDHPQQAADSYKTARSLRAREGKPFVQAALTLARAYNQQMYATRSIEHFSEAEGALQESINSELFGAYPYYVLSITHRLAGEIYEGSLGTRDDGLVDYHFERALNMAQKGQQVARPGFVRPIAAEAMCLESMGEYNRALEARSRQIQTSDEEYSRCEGLHYRWRLNYWTGRLDEAMEDVRALNGDDGCSGDSFIFYQNVYPALVLAEKGDMKSAADLVRKIVEDDQSAMSVIWASTMLRILGQANDAQDLLLTYAGKVDFDKPATSIESSEWIRKLYEFVSGSAAYNTLLEASENHDQPWRLRGELQFHNAAILLARGDRESALHEFANAFRSYDNERRYTFHAKIFCVKLTQDAEWPPWIKDNTLELVHDESVQ